MAKQEEKTPRNRRLDPEVRKSLILDAAAKLVAEEGLDAVSMERVGREARVSKALVYAYYPNRVSLLQELLLREHAHLVERQAIEVKKSSSFEDLIRRTTSTYLRYVEERGVHIQRLMSEPSVVAAFKEFDRKDRQRVVDFLAKEISSSYKIPKRMAALAAEVSMGMTGVAGDLINRGVVDRRTIEELTISLALGSLEALSKKYRREAMAPTPARKGLVAVD